MPIVDELLAYYQEELAYFRRVAPEFARRHPSLARRLRMSEAEVDDPHVERLIARRRMHEQLVLPEDAAFDFHRDENAKATDERPQNRERRMIVTDARQGREAE